MSLQEATERVYEIRRLYDAGAVACLLLVGSFNAAAAATVA